MTRPILLTIANVHAGCLPSGGEAPEFNDDTAYLGYFKDRNGEQFVFVHVYGTAEFLVYIGDCDWKPYLISEERGELVLPHVLYPCDRAALVWIASCWEATAPYRTRVRELSPPPRAELALMQ